MSIIAGKYNIIPASERRKDDLYGLLYLNNRKNVNKRYGVTTGNLFVQKSAFDNIGYFSTDHPSGNDILWTKKALSQNYVIHYVPEAVVDYHGQTYEQLRVSIKKYFSGIVHQEKQGQWSTIHSLISLLKYLMPMRWSTFKSALDYRGLTDLTGGNKCYLYAKIWWLKLLMAKSYFTNN